MDSKVKIYLKRAQNEFQLAKGLIAPSHKEDIKLELEINKEETFYSSVISHAYYSIFYSAKALLLIKGIDAKAPEVHKKTFDKFNEVFIESGILDVELLNIYRKMIIRADSLLQIFKDEKWKRGHYTYHTISQANKEPAEESIQNANIFLSNIIKLIEKRH